MARPRKCRFIEKHPEVTFFKPQGIPLRELQEEQLDIEGYEALRLVDLLGQSIEEASVVMGVPRHIVSRVLAEGRRLVASAIVNGKALRIEGGNYRVKEEPLRSPHMNTKENNMTILAITSEGPGLESRVDSRFGRAAGFVIVNTETMEVAYLDNGSSQTMAHGAGIQTAQNVADKGVTVVLTGYVGPKAWQALQAAGIKVGQDLENLTVGEAVQRFKDGLVPMAETPNK